jgi:hypothetical protein
MWSNARTTVHHHGCQTDQNGTDSTTYRPGSSTWDDWSRRFSDTTFGKRRIKWLMPKWPKSNTLFHIISSTFFFFFSTGCKQRRQGRSQWWYSHHNDHQYDCLVARQGARIGQSTIDWHQLSTMAITIQSTLATWYEITLADYDRAVKSAQSALSIAKKQRKRSPTYPPPASQQQVYKNNATTTCRQAIRDPYCRIKRTRDVPRNLCCWCHRAIRNNSPKQ